MWTTDVSHRCGSSDRHADRTTSETADEHGRVTRAVEVVLDPSPSREPWLRSYAGSMRAVYNRAPAEVSDTCRSHNQIM